MAGGAHTYITEIRAPAELEAKKLGLKEYPLMQRQSPHICDIPETIRAMEDGRVKALWCCGNNLIVAEIDSRRIWNAMKNKLEFTFVSDFFMTPTAELADIVLPAAFYTEVDNLCEAFRYPYNYVTASKKVVEPLEECRDDRWVAIEVARKMGVDVEPWGSVEDWNNWRLKYLGATFDHVWNMPEHRIIFPREFRRYEKSRFTTPTGKVELYSTLFELYGYDPLPVYHEPPESPVSTPELFKEFPLLYTHYRELHWEHSEGRQIERQRRISPDPLLEINPETAARLGIDDGDWVYLETPKSAGKWRVKYRAKLVPKLLDCVVAGPHAWWFPEKPGPEHGCFDSNINALLSLDPPYDPVIGNGQFRAFLCRVGKVES